MGAVKELSCLMGFFLFGFGGWGSLRVNLVFSEKVFYFNLGFDFFFFFFSIWDMVYL